MFKYAYKGKEKVHIPYVGSFEPDKTYEVEKEIHHPDFEPIKEVKKEEIKAEKTVKNKKK